MKYAIQSLTCFPQGFELSTSISDEKFYLTNKNNLVCLLYQDGKCAEVDDVLPDGYRVKKGDGIYYTAYAMARMPYIWGDDAGEFRPERWLQNGIFQPQSHFKFVSFHVRTNLPNFFFFFNFNMHVYTPFRENEFESS